jgi:hypothetical protein
VGCITVWEGSGEGTTPFEEKKKNALMEVKGESELVLRSKRKWR